ncbi:hypothetical protein [Streptodolium elevatio]|uniref:Uncharacterized protein n=1 Tax=Streptodolium elevatio TaxID=3157996 RepID=A0ABV3DSB5_9ACTN
MATVLGIAGISIWMPRGLAVADVPWPAVVALLVLATAAPVVVFVRAVRRD